MSFRSLLNKRCDVEQVTDTIDAYGTSTRAWAIRHRSLACRVIPLNRADSVEQSIRDKESVKRLVKIMTEYKSGITETDRILFSSSYYHIKLVRNPGNMHHHLEIECELIE